MICGFADATSCILFGYIIKRVNDVEASIFMISMCGCCNVLYKLFGAGDGGTLAMVVLWFAILGIGSLMSGIYSLIEVRVHPEQLGSSISIMMTLANFFYCFAPNLSFLPQPLPLYVQLAGLAIIYIFLINLPPGG